jgi:hypothetical protein
MAYLEPSGIQVIKGTLTAGQINGWDVTPVQLIPPPGAGMANFVVANFFNVLVGSSAWTMGGNNWLIYGTTGNDQVNLASGLLTNQLSNMSANTNYIFGCGPGIGSDWLGGTAANINLVLSSTAINAPISITGSNPIAGGNGTINYTIWYITIGAL